MNELNIFQSSIWLVLISANLYLIWKFTTMSKELKSSASFSSNSSSMNADVKLDFNALNFQELSSIIDEIKQEEDLKKHYKIQKLMLLLNQPIHEFRTSPNIEIQDSKRETKLRRQYFRKKLVSRHPDLTEAELQLCELIIKEKNCGAIAEKLNLSNGTVRVYKNKLKSKMKINSTLSLNDYLIELYVSN